MCGAVMSAGYMLAADAKALYYMLGLSGRVREQVKRRAEKRSESHPHCLFFSTHLRPPQHFTSLLLNDENAYLPP